MSDPIILDLQAYNKGKRTEVRSPHGRLIAAKDVKVGAGSYVAGDGKTYPTVNILDPALGDGEMRIYLITRQGALVLADGFARVAKGIGG